MPFIRGNPLDARKEWWRSLPESAKNKLHHCKGPLQKIGCVSSINQLNLVRQRFYSKKVTAAKEPLQRKRHRSERYKTKWKSPRLKGRERAFIECTLREWTSPYTEVGCRGALRERTSPVTDGGTPWMDRSLRGGTSSLTGLEQRSINVFSSVFLQHNR
jgi:hypothetical protein